jgi:hypothetical protein
LAEAGFSIHAVLPAYGELAAGLEEESIPVHILSFPMWAYTGFVPTLKYCAQRLWGNLTAARKLAGLCKRLQADLVVTNTLTVPVGALAARWARLPHVWYMHELSGSAGHNLSYDLGPLFSHSLINRLSDRIIANSATVQEQLRQWIPADKIRLVYYGVEIPAPRRAHSN